MDCVVGTSDDIGALWNLQHPNYSDYVISRYANEHPCHFLAVAPVPGHRWAKAPDDHQLIHEVSELATVTRLNLMLKTYGRRVLWLRHL